MNNNRIKYLSLFTGIGGFDLPCREMGFECVGWSEIDKYAIKTFEVNFPELKGKNIGDIIKVNPDTIDNFDLLVFGSPCQSCSISSNNRIGLNGKSGLFRDGLKVLKHKHPSWFIWENVKGVLSSNKGEDWKEITKSFEKAGYNFHYQVLNSADYGIPQQRKRIFMVGQRKDLGNFNFKFPPKQELKIFLKDIIENRYTDRDVSYTIDANYFKTSQTNPRAYLEDNKRQIVFNCPVRIGQFGNGGQGERVYSLSGTSICLSANGGGWGAKTGLYKIDGGIRKLYTLECFRLQDFPDDFHDKAKDAGVSNTQLYKQAGNSVTVNVIRCILNSLFNGSNKTQLNLF